MSPPRPNQRPHHREKGIVLPVALIMLLILSFAGLMAARKSSTYEQISNNLRTNQVARQAAESGLRYCEKAVIDQVDNANKNFGAALGSKVLTTALTDDKASTLAGGEWNKKTNWKSSATNLVTMPNSTSTCIIQAMSSKRYLVTPRGLSADAVTDSTSGELTSGSEVWLQSILTPQGAVVATETGGGGVN